MAGGWSTAASIGGNENHAGGARRSELGKEGPSGTLLAYLDGLAASVGSYSEPLLGGRQVVFSATS
jgi:hypothetical protein